MTHYMQEYHNNKKKTKPQNSAALVYSYESRSKELQRSMMRASLFFELLFRRKPRRRSGFRCKRNENTKTFPFIERFFSCIRTRCKQKPLRPTSSNRTCRSDVYRPLAPCLTRDKASNNAPLTHNSSAALTYSCPLAPKFLEEGAPNRKDKQASPANFAVCHDLWQLCRNKYLSLDIADECWTSSLRTAFQSALICMGK